MYDLFMKRNHSFVWTPANKNCAICGEGHHPWDGIGGDRQEYDDTKIVTREMLLEEEKLLKTMINEMRWYL